MKFSETREALGYLTIVIFALSVIAFAALFVDALDSRERRQASESYAGRNPEVQIVSVSRQQYGKPKWNTWQLVVEMRGTKTGVEAPQHLGRLRHAQPRSANRLHQPGAVRPLKVERLTDHR